MRTAPAFRPGVTPRVIFALVMREMTTTHGRSPGGYLWAVLEPALGIAVMTYAFSFFFRAPPLGISFPLFYATGILPFLVYSDLAQKLSHAIRFSRPLLVYPRVTFFDALAARFLLNLLTQLLVVYLVTAGLLTLFETRARLDFAAIGLAIAMAAGLGGGIGALNCLLFAVAPVWERVWAIANRPAFLVSCVFYTFESVPPQLQALLWFNPLVHVVGQMRAGFYADYAPGYVSPAYVFGWAVVTGAAGLFFLRRHHKRILNEC